MKNILFFAVTLLLLFSAENAYGANKFLPATVVATTTGFAHLVIGTSTLQQNNLDGASYSVERYNTQNNFAFRTNGTQCYPLSGGSSSFSLTGSRTEILNASIHQTSNNTGGTPDCDVTGDYYILWQAGGDTWYTTYH